MALKVKNLVRVFVIAGKNNKTKNELADPNPNMEPLDVMKFYSGKYPELTSSSVSGPKVKDDKAIYTFQTIIGDKG